MAVLGDGDGVSGFVGVDIEDDVDVGGRASHQAVAHGSADDVCGDTAVGEEGGHSADDM